MNTTLTPFMQFWRELNLALVAQGEPEARLGEARDTYEAHREEQAAEADRQLREAIRATIRAA